LCKQQEERRRGGGERRRGEEEGRREKPPTPFDSRQARLVVADPAPADPQKPPG
jgi:hypothetical protein